MTTGLAKTSLRGRQRLARRDYDALGAAVFVEQIRTPHTAATAEVDPIIKELGGIILYAPIPTHGLYIEGGEGRPFRVAICKTDPACTQLITKGHELGHHFLMAVADPAARASWGEPAVHQKYNDPRGPAIEAFCDYFAHQLIGVPPCLVDVGETA